MVLAAYVLRQTCKLGPHFVFNILRAHRLSLVFRSAIFVFEDILDVVQGWTSPDTSVDVR